MKFEEIISDLQNKIYRPVYFLMGEEAYFIDEISDYIAQHVLTDVEKEFNQSVVYGRDLDVATLLSYVKRFPMMSNYQVVIVKEAQDLKNLVPDGRAKEDNGAKHPMEAYFENPLKSTILVLCYKYKTIDRRKTYAKSIEKHGLLFTSTALYEDRVPAWIDKYLKSKNYTIRPEAAAMLAEYLGADLGKIANELSKLAINVAEGAEITPLHIEQNIGISKDFNIFELQKALGKKDAYKCFQIVNYFAANPKQNPIQRTIPALYSYFSRILKYHYARDKSRSGICSTLGINPYFYPDYQKASRTFDVKKTRHIISLLRTYDMKSKGVDNATIADGELMKELVFQLLN